MLEHIRDHGRCHGYDSDAGITEKQDEIFVIIEADAIQHPWTIVIHTKDTAVQLRVAMMASIGFVTVTTFLAETRLAPLLFVLEKLREIDALPPRRGRWDTARIGEHGAEVRDERHN